ncbi:hypothetical protein [Pyrococcus sp. ST04]|uniref:hypothetical protein n=1 Tax=Pyrococcus sp. ST04 TaxID=1183377 RepID=UPI0002605BF3|nr:hypothetical protein [Pyrococcus sp. ST04]AFK22927.1 hypothetical protein Py04_1353 [Pyrococcus sp. ST04]
MVMITSTFYIEALGNDKKAVETSILEIERKIKREKNVEVLEVVREDIIETEDPKLKYSAVLEAKIRGDLENIVDVLLRYGPSIVEIEDVSGNEIHAEKLVKILAKVSAFMGKLIDAFGSLAAYPDLSKLPRPKIGYSDEEIEEMIIDKGLIRYRLVVELFGKSQQEIEENFIRALSLEGAFINKFASKIVNEEDINGVRRVKLLFALELLSNLETLFIFTAKLSPIAIVIIEPEYIEITPNELQNSLSELAAIINELVHRPLILSSS